MCGIVGYIGHRSALGVILEGLKRLEYRGYDSAGVAVLNGPTIQVRRSVGKIQNLEVMVRERPAPGSVGLGHTRWATHGRPSEANAHPHADCTTSLVVVHNGILENYLPLKTRLTAQNHLFRSETDSEVLAHLAEGYMAEGASFHAAVKATLREVRGTYAVAFLSTTAPDEIIAAKHGAGAVVVGVGEGETFIASDIPALLRYTRQVIVLEDGEVAVVGRDRVSLSTLDGREVKRPVSRVTWDASMAEKAGYPHFMLKEIHEQPDAVANTMRGRILPERGAVLLPEACLTREFARRLRRVVLVGCGTSYHAALVGRFMIEHLAGLPAEVDIGSEFRSRDAMLGRNTLVVAISQSGETADTLAAATTARQQGAPLLAITNVVGSALAREAAGVIYTHAGPEIGVASTKTFTATLTACYLLGLALGLKRNFLTAEDGRKRIGDLLSVPALLEQALAGREAVERLADDLVGYQNMLYLGRGLHYPLALEGALKLKEIAYVHAEGYPAGEMKHGPIALIDERMPVVALTPRDGSYDRMVGNVEEVKTRGGKVLAVCHAGDAEIARKADWLLPLPPTVDLLAPLVSAIPLQLLAYYIAVRRGCDVDQPRNLAKSVTVE